MKLWKFVWGQRGRKPSVNQLDHETIAKVKETGTLYVLAESSGGAKTVVEIAGGPSANDHPRSHQIDSADDHPAVPEEKRNKLVATNAETGQIELIEKSSLDKTYRHSQSSPSVVWQVTHFLGKYPSVSVTDSSGSEVEGEVQYIDSNNLLLTFSAPFAGYADLN